MSKPVRISDYLADELEKIATRENRSLANLVQHLLTQAIRLNEKPTQANSSAPRVTVENSWPMPHEPIATPDDDHFKPDFKK